MRDSRRCGAAVARLLAARRRSWPPTVRARGARFGRRLCGTRRGARVGRAARRHRSRHARSSFASRRTSHAFAAVAVIGSDPFTKGERSILPVTPTATDVDVRVPARALRRFSAHRAAPVRSANPAPDEAPTARRLLPRRAGYRAGIPIRDGTRNLPRRAHRPRARKAPGARRHDPHRTRRDARPLGAETGSNEQRRLVRRRHRAPMVDRLLLRAALLGDARRAVASPARAPRSSASSAFRTAAIARR